MALVQKFKKVNHLFKDREQWIGGKCFLIRGSVEYTWIKTNFKQKRGLK